MLKGLIFDIKRYAVHDGPGIRTTVFFKGCSANCWWCHNPESQDPEIEKSIRINTFDGRTVQEEEIIGKQMTVEEVMKEIKKDQVFFDESGGGVTLSGGEPLFQPEFLESVLINCKNDGIHTSLDTTGYAPLDVFKSIIPYVDLFLYDLKFIDDRLHQKYTGVSNENILLNLKNLARNYKKVIVRIPVIPGVTNEELNVSQMINFINDIDSRILQIDLLPYHKIAKHKYDKLNKEYLMGDTDLPDKRMLTELKKKMESAGLKVHIGG
jgi:pyruvate formate lyase activating enzyme